MLLSKSSSWCEHGSLVELDRRPSHRIQSEGPARGGADFDAVMAALSHAVQASAIFISLHSSGYGVTPAIFPCIGAEELPSHTLARIAAMTDPRMATTFCGPSDRLDWIDYASHGSTWQVLRMAAPCAEAGKTAVLHLLFAAADAWDRQRCEAAFRLLQVPVAACLRQWVRDLEEASSIPGFCSALDGLDFGVILLDSSERILFANRAGNGFLDEASHVRRSGAMISAPDLHDAYALQVSIRHAIASSAVSAATAKSPVIALGSGRADRPIFASVVAAGGKAGAAGEVAAIVYLQDPQCGIAEKLPPVCKLYDLSPVESRFVALLVAGESLREAALAMRIKEQTARSYLKQIFLKTNTRRQADLVRLMLCSILHTNQDLEPLRLNASPPNGGSGWARSGAAAARAQGQLILS
jgi:DNA-binding CsgD family transcriptional regulator